MGFLSSVGSVLGFGRDESKADSTTTQKAAPRTKEAQQLWDRFITDFLNKDTGYKASLQSQENALAPILGDYTGYLSKLMYGEGPGAGLLDPAKISFGGGAPMNIYTRGQQGMLSTLANIANQRYGAQAERLPGWATEGYLNALWPMLMQTEGLRYSIPSTHESGSIQGPRQNLLSWTNRLGGSMQSLGKGYGSMMGGGMMGGMGM